MEITSTLQGLEKSAEDQLLIRKKRQAELTAKRVADRRKLNSHLGVVNWSNAKGMRFGRLVVQGIVGRTKSRSAIVSCLCDCGKFTIVKSTCLRVGDTRSCGCMQSESAMAMSKLYSYKHGHASSKGLSKMYIAYQNMMARCYRSKHPRYHGRGIIVCQKWKIGENNKTGFQCFLDDVPEPTNQKFTLDRIDNNGNYEPGNVKWSTMIEQNNNQERNIILNFNGKSLTLTQWSLETGIPRNAIRSRIFRRKWTVEKALTTPNLK